MIYHQDTGGIIIRQVSGRVTNQADSSGPVIANRYLGSKRQLAFEAQAPLLCVRHLQSGIDECFGVSRSLRAGHKYESVRWIGKTERIELRIGIDGGRGGLAEEQSLRRIETQARAALRKDGLKNATVRDPEAAANCRLLGPAEQPLKEAFFKCRAVSECDPRLDVILVGAEWIDYPSFDLARSRDIFVSHTQIERQARPHTPGIFAVKVRFVDSVLEEKRSKSFLESADAAIEHRVEAGGVIDAVAIVAETPEAAREIVSQIVQTLAANVGSGF